MFEMFREFCAVGQGAFYRETFKGKGENINVIYDCGASPCKKCVKREIERVFEKGEIIHALFISHFHEDHVNGIPFLIQHCNVKRIFFPLLSEENKILLKIKLYIEDQDSFAYKFIEDPKKAIGNIEKESLDYNEPILIGVLEGEQRNDVEQIDVEDNMITCDEVIHSGENVSEKIDGRLVNIEWSYIPYNFRQEDRIKALKVELSKQGIKMEDLIKSGLKKDEKMLKDIKKVYVKVVRNFNSNSMTLFSGVLETCIGQWYHETWISFRRAFFGCQLYKHLSGDISCLYTGDYDASGDQMFNELKDKYNQYWSSIGCIQIPHHGSRHNHNIKLIEKGRCYIISAGYKNKYNHPDPQVIKEICLEGGIPLIVTEKTSSIVLCIIFF